MSQYNLLTRIVLDECYTRNILCALNQISTFLLLSLGRYEQSSGGYLVPGCIIGPVVTPTSGIDDRGPFWLFSLDRLVSLLQKTFKLFVFPMIRCLTTNWHFCNLSWREQVTSCLQEGSCLIYVICICLHVFLFCLASYSVLFVASFSGLIILIAPSVFSKVYLHSMI